jgi:hypothetical protein
LLAQQSLDRLQALARAWNVSLSGGAKSSVVDQLSAHFADPALQQSLLVDLPEESLRVLTYVHLFLAPEYGLSADSIARGILQRRQRAAQPSHPGDPMGELGQGLSTHALFGRRDVHEQIAVLAERGLLMPFRQNSVLYYALPNLVRDRLGVRPDLVSRYAMHDESKLELRETTFGALIHKLFSLWNILSLGRTGSGEPLTTRVESAQDPTAEGVSAAVLDWAITVPAPSTHLQRSDRRHICRQTGSTGGQIDFYYALLEALGTVSGSDGQPITVSKPALQRFLRLPASSKILALWNAWVYGDPWSEMRLVLGETRTQSLRLKRNLADDAFGPEDLQQEWFRARKVVLRYLALLPESEWLSVSALLKAVYDVHPGLLHTTSDSTAWWLESSVTGRQFGTAFEDWRQSYGQFVLSMLTGPLHWLGMVRLAFAADQDPSELKTPDVDTADPSQTTPVAFQLTETGVFALGRRKALVPSSIAQAAPHESSCSISDDLRVALVPDRAPLDLHELLHTTGRLVEATPDRFAYQLTAEGVSRWVAARVESESQDMQDPTATLERLIALLAQYCGSSAQTWADKLRTWHRNRGLLHVYENITLIELADDYALQELLASTPLDEYLIHQFSPRLVAIWSDGVDPLLNEMEQRGYTPRVR